MNTKEKFREMIRNSWTYNKFTIKEAEAWEDILNSTQTNSALKYGEKHEWEVLQAIYASYLAGLGYDGFNWRD